MIQDDKGNLGKKRMGMSNSCIVSLVAQHKIILYYTETRHAGVNLISVLVHRDTDKEPIIQMCDDLSVNLSNEIRTILCDCLRHGFRKFRLQHFINFSEPWTNINDKLILGCYYNINFNTR